MRNHCLVLALLGLLGATPVAQAEDYRIDFLEGLRERGYYEYALLYLNQLEESQNIPDEVRQVLDYEKAVTYMQDAQRGVTPEAQRERLDQASAFLEQFVREHPDHPKAGEANSQRARILLNQARVEIWQSESPTNEGNEAEFQQRARDLIAQAREIFQTAHDQHKETWESFPKFLDQQEDKEQYAARQKAEVAYIRAQLDLALCTYEEAQTYDEDDPQYSDLLTKASTEFEEIHSKYRSQLGGLYARMWQGKCFEEQDQIREAIGIYDELLDHGGTSAALTKLQDQALEFRLICLNHEKRKDYQLVQQEAGEWLTQNRRKSRTSVGLGIRWQLANALEALAERREISGSDRERLLRDALEQAREIEKYPGQYKEPAQFMVRRLNVELRGKEAGDPEEFDEAYGIASNMVEKISELRGAIEAAETDEERAEAQQEFNSHMQETARMLQLALRLVEADTPKQTVNRARVQLSYVLYQMKRSYEAAILGEFVARHADKEQQSIALDGAYFALAAYVQAYNRSAREYQDVDMKQMERIGTLITSRWPETDRANDARMILGKVFRELSQPAKAAEWYSQVPKTSERYSEAQRSAGQAYWAAFLEAAPLPEEEQPPRDTLDQWQKEAQQHLRNGIEKTQGELADTADSPHELIAAKVSLAQILVNEGDYEGALALLTEAPHDVVNAIAVPDESARPDAPPIKTTAFASAVYQLLLRTHIGLQQLDEARATMTKLEAVAGGEDSAQLTQIYKQLGEELEKELERLKGLGDEERLTEVRESFETFLNDLYNRDQQTYSSLLWIGETYYGLGKGSDDGSAQANEYFSKAASTYETILEQSDQDPEFVDPSRLLGVKLRLVNCKRLQGDFEAAFEMAVELLKEKPQALQAQTEAALILQEWAGSGQGDTWKKYKDAINGLEVEKDGEDVPVWGWGLLARRLQLSMNQQEDTEKYKEQLMEARYNMFTCRLEYGKNQSSSAERQAELKKAKQGLIAFAGMYGSQMENEWWDKFDRLYGNVQRELGETPVVALERPKEYEATARVADTGDEAAAKKAEEEKLAAARRQQRQAEREQGSGWAMFIVALLVVGAAGAGLFFMVKGQTRTRKVVYEAFESPQLPEPGTARRKKAASPQAQAKAQQARKKKKSAGTSAGSSQSGQSKEGSKSSSAAAKKKTSGQPTKKTRPSKPQ